MSRRVVASYLPFSFEMCAVCAFLRRNGLPVRFSFPPLNFSCSMWPRSPLEGVKLTCTSSVEVLCFDYRGTSAIGVEHATTCGGSSDEGSVPAAPPIVVVFQDGTLVGWGLTEVEVQELRQRLFSSKGQSEGVALPQVAEECVESMAFDISGLDSGLEAEAPRALAEDARRFIDPATGTLLVGERDATMHILAFSFALAQHVKMDAVFSSLAPLSSLLQGWQQRLFRRGSLLFSTRSLRRAKTHLLTLNEFVNFRLQLQTTPKMLWIAEDPLVREAYVSACEYLELHSRATDLRRGLQSIDESLSYLQGEAHSVMMEFLTLIIILLIMAEIAITLR